LEEEIGKVCYLCGKKIQDNEKYVEDWLRHYHISCLCEWARKKRFYEESIELTKRIMDELNSKGAVAINNNGLLFCVWLSLELMPILQKSTDMGKSLEIRYQRNAYMFRAQQEMVSMLRNSMK